MASQYNDLIASISTILVFSPVLESKKAKPLEEDIQDAKLIFYYPPNTDVALKRSHVGDGEGITMFFQRFSPGEPVEFIATESHTQVIKEVEKDVWVIISLQHVFDNSLNYAKKHDEFYDENLYRKILQQYYDWFVLFHGPIGSYLPDRKEEIERKMLDYSQIFVSQLFDKIRFDYLWKAEGIQYCPLLKPTFLDMHAYINELNGLVDYQAKYALLHHGLLVDSNLPRGVLNVLYDYFVESSNPEHIAFSKLQSFGSIKEAHQISATNTPFGAYNRLTSFGEKGFLMGKNPHGVPGGEFEPFVYCNFDEEESNEYKKYRLVVHYSEELMTILIVNPELELSEDFYQKFTAIHGRNQERMQYYMNEVVAKIRSQESGLRYFYYNEMNRALKYSSRFGFSALDIELCKQLNVARDLIVNQGCTDVLIKAKPTWIVATRSNSRIVFLYLNPSYPLDRAAKERKRVLDALFSNIYIEL